MSSEDFSQNDTIRPTTTIVDSCLAHTKSHSQVNSLALTVSTWRHWSREPITTLSGP